MPIYFITGNANKFKEAQAILKGIGIQQLNIELPEIQEVDPAAIIEAKLQAAFSHHDGEFIVEDTSLSFDCLNGLPGPLIKWFLKALGDQGLYEMASKLGSMKATAKTVVGYAKDKNQIQYFEGVTEGEIVAPRGGKHFGWDPIFQPAGFPQTYAEMTDSQKNEISARAAAFKKLLVALKS
jgi:non-canonical purine NTP pyrophosphatase (RdgB/HAM1 family)